MGVRSPDGPKQSERRHKKAAPEDAACRLEHAGELRRGVAVLGPDELRFHTGRTGREGADFHLHLPYDQIRSAELDAHGEALVLETSEDGRVVLHIGRHAAAWKQRLGQRPSRLGELGLAKGARVALVGLDDPELERELGGSAEGDGLDAILCGVAHPADLRRLGELARRVRPGGTVWAVMPAEGRSLPKPDEVAAAARAAGLTATSTVKLSRTQRAVKLAR
jgi:hypothetical protein